MKSRGKKPDIRYPERVGVRTAGFQPAPVPWLFPWGLILWGGLKTRGPISRLYDVDITPHDLREREIQFEPLLTNPRHCQFITPLMA